MAVAIKSATGEGFGGTATWNLTEPSLADGDFAVIVATTDSDHAITTPPTGFTHHGTVTDVTPDSSSSLFSKYIATAAGETWAITFSGTEAGAVGMILYTGAKSTSTISPVPLSAASGSTATPATATYTPDNANSMVVCTYGTDPTAGRTGTQSTGFTERLDFIESTTGYVYVEELLQTTAVAVNGQPTFNAADRYCSWIFAIAPTVAGGAVVIPTVNQAPLIPSGSRGFGDWPGRGE